MTTGKMQRGRLALEAAGPTQGSLLATWTEVPHSSGPPEESLEDTLMDRGYRSDMLL